MTPKELKSTVARQAEPGTPLLVARSVLTFQGRHRVGVFALRGGKPELLVDDFVPDGKTKNLVRTLAAGPWPVRACQWDAMYATPWTLIWTREPPFVLWNPQGELAQGGAGDFSLRGESVDAVRVEAWYADDMVDRGVRLRMGDGSTVDLKRVSELAAEVDPTYDRMDLSMDAEWASALARDIASVTGLALQDDIP